VVGVVVVPQLEPLDQSEVPLLEPPDQSSVLPDQEELLLEPLLEPPDGLEGGCGLAFGFGLGGCGLLPPPDPPLLPLDQVVVGVVVVPQLEPLDQSSVPPDQEEVPLLEPLDQSSVLPDQEELLELPLEPPDGLEGLAFGFFAAGFFLGGGCGLLPPPDPPPPPLDQVVVGVVVVPQLEPLDHSSS
jgi:hypothetical protein